MTPQIALEHRRIVGALARRLTDLGLPELLALYASDKDRSSDLRADLPLLPGPLRGAARFLALGDPADVGEIRDILTDDVVALLQQLEIARISDGAISLGRVRLVRHHGILIFCETPSESTRFHYGEDSSILGRFLLPARGRVLDVCAGVGAQGLLCALTADAVVAVEREPSVAQLFGINAVLNGLEDRIELRLGDFVEPVRNEIFDRICCNPPLLPIPDSLPFPLVGHGGPDGTRGVRTLMERLPHLLATEGRCHILAMLLGDAQGPHVDAFRMLAGEAGLNVLMILPWREPLTTGSPCLEGFAATASRYGRIPIAAARDALLASYAAQAASHLYACLLVITRERRRPRGLVELTRHFLRGET